MSHTPTQPITLDASERLLTHNLEPYLEEIKRFKTLHALQTSELYEKIGPEIDRTINGLAWYNTQPAPSIPQNIRVVAWNIERGLKLDGIIHLLQTHPTLATADILLITEADIGMGRTNNRNIPQEIANALQMNYVFANCFLALEKGDIGELNHDQPNTLSLHGISIFSKFPIQSCQSVTLPMFKDAFNDIEKRLGSRKALICTIPIGPRTIDFAVTHLELAQSAKHRGLQIQALLHTLSENQTNSVLIGGDFNTVTYNLLSKKHLFASLAYRTLWGIHGAIQHYMTPDKHFEKPLFQTLHQYGFDYHTFNDRSQGTLYYDINDPIFEAKIRQYHIPAFVLSIIKRALKQYNGRVPLRLDWFAGKNMDVVTKSENGFAPPQVIDTPLWQNKPVSDHSPIVVDLKV